MWTGSVSQGHALILQGKQRMHHLQTFGQALQGLASSQSSRISYVFVEVYATTLPRMCETIDFRYSGQFTLHFNWLMADEKKN